MALQKAEANEKLQSNSLQSCMDVAMEIQGIVMVTGELTRKEVNW